MSLNRIVVTLLCLLFVGANAPDLRAQRGQRAAGPRPAQAEHAILVVIDGFSYLAPERIEMPNLKAIMARGTYFQESYSAPPQHPHSGEWAEAFDSSIPNPILVSGTVFLKPGQKFVQSSFFPLKFTAHIANELTYKAINEDFHFTFQAGGRAFHTAHNDIRVDDDENMFWTINVLQRWKPTYMRVHLQDTGAMGGASRPNIWAENSPYREALKRADAHLGTLMYELRQLGIYDKTVIFITGDHGQTVTGGHPPFAQDAWPMPLIIAGPGVKADQRFPYSEQVDVVPTLCYLMGAPLPDDNVIGRVLAEALVSPPTNAPERQGQPMKELSMVLMEGDTRIGKLREAAKTNASLQSVLADVEKDFYDVEKLLRWRQFGTVAKLIAHNQEVLKRIPASIQ